MFEEWSPNLVNYIMNKGPRSVFNFREQKEGRIVKETDTKRREVEVNLFVPCGKYFPGEIIAQMYGV